MANSLFNYKDVRNNPRRSSFDLSNKLCYTAKIGELLPVYWKFVNPGDYFKFGVQHLTRTQPVNSSAFTRLREYYDWFFVPMRLLWKSFPTFITQMQNNPVQADSFTSSVTPSEDTPYFPLQYLVGNAQSTNVVQALLGKENQFGFDRANLWAKLCSHLGYFRLTDKYVEYVRKNPASSKPYNPVRYNVPVSVFPLAAYHKIYNDFYRFEQWEKATPFLWNFDYSTGGQLPILANGDAYWNGVTLFDLHYSNFNKDLIMGLMPNQQYGDAATIDGVVNGRIQLSGDFPALPVTDIHGTFGNAVSVKPYDIVSDNPITNVQVRVPSNTQSLTGGFFQTKAGNFHASVDSLDDVSSQFTVIALRQAEALQRWKEIAQAGDQTYRDQIYRHFGVSLPDELSDLCQFLGGDSSSIDISEVVNNNLSDDNQTDIKGKGVGVGNQRGKRRFKEHGIFMCIYHASVLLDYDLTAIDPQLTFTSVQDFFIPEFDRIGMEELPTYVLNNSYSGYENGQTGTLSQADFLGYTTRYFQYKTSIDRVLGEFRESLNYWVAPIDNDYLEDAVNNKSLSYTFFKCNPHILDNIFGVVCDSTCLTDQLLINAFFGVKAVREMDYSGLPY